MRDPRSYRWLVIVGCCWISTLCTQAQGSRISVTSSTFGAGIGTASSSNDSSLQLNYAIGAIIGDLTDSTGSILLKSGLPEKQIQGPDPSQETPRTPLIPSLPSFYANDGIDDEWQRQFFGNANPSGLSNIDADQDGQDNRFEYLAGSDPTDSSSRFELSLKRDPAIPDQVIVSFSPHLDNRRYELIASPTLNFRETETAVTPISTITTSLTTNQGGSQRPTSFFRVQILFP